MDEIIIYNLTAMLIKYLPNIFHLYNDKKIDRLVQLGKVVLERRDNQYQQTGPFLAETTIWELLTFVEYNQNQDALSWLNTIDRIVNELCSILDKVHILQIRKICDAMLSCNSKDKSEYRRHLSELATILRLIKQEGISIKQVEEKLPNGKRIDFSLFMNGIVSLMEIFNIDYDMTKLHSDDDVFVFLQKRIVDKIADKVINLGKTNGNIIYLVVVLWGEFQKLLKYETAIDRIINEYPNIFLMTFVKYTDDSGSIIHEFENIKIVFEKLKKAKIKKE